MSSPRSALLRHHLATFYRPAGTRLGVLLSSGCDTAVTDLVATLLTEHGHAPQRRLARLHPRPGEPGLRSDDMADFLRRYGHEYAVAWLPSVDPGTGREADIVSITAAARGSGCAIGWDLAERPDDPAHRLASWGVDFALWPEPDGVVGVFPAALAAPLTR